MPVHRALNRALDICGRVFHVSAEVCLVVMLVANIANIASRAIFDKGLVLVFPWTVVLFVWLVSFGFYPVYRGARDITVDFLVFQLGPRGQLVSRLFTGAIVLVLMGVFLSKAPYILASQGTPIDMVGMDRYMLSVPFFLSCALIFAHYVLDVIDAFKSLAKAES